ncbi:MAG: gamma-glutamylcyclotransferase family protein [Patescibacteria group bacterium]
MPYFAYGSNMDVEQLKERFKKISDANFSVIGIAILPKYDFRFNKKSTVDGSGKANIISDQKSEVEGVIFELTDEQFKVLDEIEKGYHRKNITVNLQKQSIKVITYIADIRSLCKGLSPTEEYLEKITKGAKYFNLSKSYQEKLSSYKTK